ncbi:hypothetical protein ABT127_28090 [Streptomyces sp. NPDC001904]|uniref:hypothetical protein n=1 Tax=Streptomyces sp. NPDC001904 TaxID=3154531 RepID=UPI00332D901F
MASRTEGGMANGGRNERLAALLVESGWSAAELARAVNALGSAQGLRLRYDRTSVAHWLSGSRPRSPVPDLVAAALTSRVGHLITAQDTGLAQTSQAPVLVNSAQPREIQMVRRLLDLWHADADPRRRALLAHHDYRLSALTLPAWPPASRSTVEQCAEDGSPEPSTVTLREMTQTFAQLADQHGGRLIRPLLATYLRDTASPYLAAPTPLDPGQREVFTGTAQLTHLLAGMADDSGHLGLAQDYFHGALRLARAVTDGRQYAITLRAMSAQALRLGHVAQALRLADGALTTLGPCRDGAVQSFLLSQRAHARARTGERRLARADLRAAETHHERASSASGPFSTYPRAGLEYQRFQTLSALQDRAPALAALEASVRHRAEGERKATALTHARLAEVHLSAGRLDAAVPHVQAFLDRYPLLHSAHTETAHQRLDEALARFPRQREALALRDQARAVLHPLADT